MKHLFLFYSFCCIALNTWGLNVEKQVIWQQNKIIWIDSLLDSENKELKFHAGFWFGNNNSDSLNPTIFNFGGIAFKNQPTSYSKQLLSAGKYGLYNKQKDDNARNDSLNFFVMGAIKLQILSDSSYLNIFPILGYNYYDKLYAGCVIGHHLFNVKKLQFIAMPSWSFTQKKLIGCTRISSSIYNGDNRLSSVILGVQGQTFSLSMGAQINQYYRINPFLKFNFVSKNIDTRLEEKYFILNFVNTGIFQKTYRDTNNGLYLYPNYLNWNYFRTTYVYDNHHPINRIGFKWNSEYAYNYSLGKSNSQYGKTWLNLVYKYKYDKGKKYFRSEFFAGVFLKRNGNTGSQLFSINNNGQNDYLFQEALLGRSENSNGNILLSKQLVSIGGNMRNLIPVSPTDRWMLALNNDIHLPGIIPLKLYLDLVYYKYLQVINQIPVGVTKPELYYTAGLSIELFHKTLEIFVPLVYSKQFKGYSYWNYNVFNSIGFKLNLNQLEPSKLIQNFILENKFKIQDSL